MFTGLIQSIGTITSLVPQGAETRFQVKPEKTMENLILGESIAVNGVCLTVEQFGQDWFEVYASGETMGLTNLGSLRVGSQVNLERAMATGDRFGGHLVSGHVDCLATVTTVRPAGESTMYLLSFPPAFGPLVVPKGSVALDGISLTVNACAQDNLEVNIIPATQKETIIASWKTGVQVNMEADIIGKYVQRMLAPWKEQNNDNASSSSSISKDFLKKHGF